MQLINLMHKYKMIFPKIQIGGFKDLEKRFGLDGDRKHK